MNITDRRIDYAGRNVKFAGKGNFINNLTTQLSNPKNLAPVLLLEATVVAGRCHQAKKRGGWVELRERFCEEISTSIVWLFGIGVLNKLGDKFFKKFFNLDTTIQLGRENLSGSLEKIRKSPIERFADGRLNPKKYGAKLLGANFVKIATSILVANYIIGFVIPKTNQAITNYLVDKKKKAKEKALQEFATNKLKGINPDNNNKTALTEQKSFIRKESDKLTGFVSMKDYLNFTRRQEPSFKGAENIFNTIRNAGYNLENHTICKLLSTDIGVTGGRTINARNNDERIEILFRDLTSIFFYVASTPLLIKAFSKLFDKKLGLNTNLDPKAASIITDEMSRMPNLSKESLLGKEVSQKTIDDVAKLLGKDEFNVDEFGRGLTTLGIHSEDAAKLAGKFGKLNSQIITSDKLMEVSNLLNDLSTRVKDAKLKADLNNYSRHFSNMGSALYEETRSGNILKIGEFKLNDGHIKKLFSKREIKNSIPDNAKLNLSGLFKALDDLKLADNQEILDILKSTTNSENIIKLLKNVSGTVSNEYIIKEQIGDILKGGLINDPQLLSRSFAAVNPDMIDNKKYVATKGLDSVKENIQLYLEKTLNKLGKAEGDLKQLDKTITMEDIKKVLTGMKNRNSLTKVAYVATSLTVSAFFLSYVIPKVQCYITKKRTGEDKFPGTKGMEIDAKALKPDVRLA